MCVWIKLIDAGPFNVLNAQHHRLRQIGKCFYESKARMLGDKTGYTKLKRTSVVLLVSRFVADHFMYLPHRRRKLQLDISSLLSK